MPIELIGEHPLAKDEKGNLKFSTSSIFLDKDDPVLVARDGNHTAQCRRYIAHLTGKIGEIIPKEDLESKIEQRVDLVIRDDTIFVRPPTSDIISLLPPVRKPNNKDIEQTLLADEILQEFGIPKQDIKFLGTFYEEVRQAMKKRGELWRINAQPQTTEEMKKRIEDAKITLSDKGPVYYYNMETGTRWVTYQEFSRLEKRSWRKLAEYLNEIRFYSQRKNPINNPEVTFFMTGDFNFNSYKNIDFINLDKKQVKQIYRELKQNFHNIIPSDFKIDDPENPEWRQAMFSSLIGFHEEEISEEVLLGLCPEFYMHIQWLPGAMIKKGEIILDSCFIDKNKTELYDTKVKNIIANVRREYGKIDYINVGKIIDKPLSEKEKELYGRKEVYLAVFKIHGKKKETKKIIRMQKWSTYEIMKMLDEKDLGMAFLRSHEYERYVKDRYNACEQLGMSLLPIETGEIYEITEGREVPLTYFKRDYIDGIASDKIPVSRYEDRRYSKRFFELLGLAAASNIILGKVYKKRKKARFDAGDEIIQENIEDMPSKFISSNITDTFENFKTPLSKFVKAYAQPVIKRAKFLPNKQECAKIYVKSFVKRFREIKEDYMKNKASFRDLFNDRIYDKKRKTTAYRWDMILDRLEATDPEELGKEITAYIRKRLKF